MPQKKRTLIMEIIAICLLLYTALTVFIFFRQEKLLFFPTQTKHTLPAEKNIEQYSLSRSVKKSNDDSHLQHNITLRGWLINPQYAQKRFVLYFGGNSEDVFLNIEECMEIDAAILFVNYRGYGNSDGKPTEAALFSDALAIYDDIQNRFAPQKFFAMGRSLGSGIATYLAAKRKPDAIILATPYYSISRLAQVRYPWLPVYLLLKHKFESFRYAQDVSVPVTVIYGGADRTVPPRHTRDLIRCFHAPLQEVFINNAGHGTIDRHAEYWQAILHTIFEKSP